MKTKSETRATPYKTSRLKAIRENRQKPNKQAFEKRLEEHQLALKRAFRLGFESWCGLANSTHSLRAYEVSYRTQERLEAFERDRKAQKATRRRSAAR